MSFASNKYNRYRIANRIYERWLYLRELNSLEDGMDFTALHDEEIVGANPDRISYYFHPDTYGYHGNHLELSMKIPKLVVHFVSNSSRPITARIDNFGPKANQTMNINIRGLLKSIKTLHSQVYS